MNDVLKVAIIWMVISVVLVRIVPNPINVGFVAIVGVVLFISGLIINEYQSYKYFNEEVQ